MLHLLFEKLRVRLLLLVLCAVLPALGLTLYTGSQLRQASRVRVEAGVLQMARVAAVDQQRMIQNAQELLGMLAQLDEIRGRAPRSCSAFLARTATSYPVYANLGVALPNGDVICSALPLTRSVNVAERRWFQYALAGSGFSVGNYEVDRIAARPTISFAAPVVGRSGYTQLVVFAALDLAHLQQSVTKTATNSRVTMLVLDNEGTVLAGYPDAGRWTGSALQGTPLVRAMLSYPGEATGTLTGPDGVARLYGFIRAGDSISSAIYVSVGLPAPDAYADVTRLIKLNALTMSLVGLLAFVAAWVGGNALIWRQLDRLVGATRRLAEGKLGVRTGIPHGPGEIGLLAQSFDQMAEVLEQREAERKRSEAAEMDQRRLAEALRDTAAALAGTLNYDEILDQILTQVGKVVPHDAANFMLIESGMAWIVRSIGYAAYVAEASVQSTQIRVEAVPGLCAMLETGQSRVVSDTSADPEWARYPESSWVLSYVGVPIRTRGETIGFLNLDCATPGFFTQEHADHLQAFADQAGAAIENARLYDQVQRHAAELEQRVAERTAALSAANARLTELDRMKSQFVSSISHELRTPLMNIKLYVSLLAHGKPGKEAQYLATVERETDLLHKLIEGLLNLSRLDQAKEQLFLQPVDINQVITTLVGDRTALVAGEGLTLEALTQPGLPPVMADAKSLREVLTNLVTNATAYTPAGGIITLSTGATSVDGHDWVTFSVRDTGPGISAEDQAHMFDRFYRGEAARETHSPGTGLGLAICQEIVTRHEGHITVASEPGHGSTFTVWLPAADC